MASVLIIDDSMFMRNKLSAVLKTRGHEIVEAEDGIKGLQAARTRHFDVVLLDIIMPGTDGLKILGLMREQLPQTPVIIVTADIQESVYRQCMELGATAVIHKLPKGEELLLAVDNALDPEKGAAR
ncbi:MAG: response regulator [Nitrospirae bacterium]|nr:MAG: response regulator [Nitrospirota bacterium]